MVVSLDLTSFQEALKYKYTAQNLKLLGYRNNPLLAWVPKSQDFGGRSMPIPIWHQGGRGKGTSVSQAQSNQAAADLREFLITRAKLYSVHIIDRETLKASVGDPHAFLSARFALMDEQLYEMTRDISCDLYRSGTGSRATVGTVDPGGLGTDYIQLTNPEDIVHFEVGMYVQSSATDGSALRDSGDAVQIIAIDRDNGYLQGDAAWATQITGFTAGDYLYERGDGANGGANVKLVGLAGWVPSTAPGTTPFFGVNRTADVTRLGGIREDGSAKTVEEAIIDAGTRCFREGARPDACFMNPVQFAELNKSLQGKAEYDTLKSADGVVGFSAIRVRTGAGDVTCVADPNCPTDKAYMLQKNTWRLHSLGGVPEMVDEDGQVLLRISNADQFEVRFAFYGQLACNRPGSNCVVTLAT